MKGGFYGLKGKEISLISIVIMSATIIIWSWEKTPGLTTFIPSQTGLQLSSAQVHIHEGEDELPSQTDSAQSYSGNNMDESNAGTAAYKEEILSSVVDEEVQHKEVLEAGKDNGLERLASSKEIERKRHQSKEEKTSKQGEHRKDLVSPMDFPERSSSVGGKDKDNHNNVAENKEILSSILDEEVQRKEALDAGKNNGLEVLVSSKEINKEKHQSKKEKTSKQEEHRKDLVSPMDFPERSSSIGGKGKRNHNNVTENKACNYAKGKWVPDNNRPLYSGFGCKQWLSGMWSCRLTQRTDFTYENLRWQPKDCQMEAFERSKFFRRMQNKTLAFVGDSLGRQQFQSLMCMITGGEETNDVEDVGKEYGLIVADGAARPNGWAYRFPSTNTTILYYWSAILCDVEPIDANNPDTDHAMHLDRPPSFLRQFIHRLDVLVLNTGHHWNRGKLKANRWVMHVGGVPNTDKKIAVIWGAKNLAINSIVHWVDSQLPKYPGLKAFFTTISPRHFMGGDWNTGGSCDNTTPMSVGKEILEDESADQIAANAVKGTGVKLLDITALSQLRDEGHISRFSITAQPGVQDCLHWCLPGVPDTWNEILFAQI